MDAAAATSFVAKPLVRASRQERISLVVAVGASAHGRPRWISVRAADNVGKTVGGVQTSCSDNSKYVVPLEGKGAFTGLIRPLSEILRDLNKRVPDNIIDSATNSIHWYHANRMLSFYAPGWCGEVREVKFSNNGSVTVVYRVTVRGSDGETHRESTGTVSLADGQFKDKDPVAAAEELAFCRACARFGFGLYLYHEDEVP